MRKSPIKIQRDAPTFRSQSKCTLSHSFIVITEETVERLRGMSGGPTVADLIVRHADGNETRFFLSVTINKGGRAVAEIATNQTSGSSVQRTVTGTKRNPRDTQSMS